jgi:hypothetical protein
MRLLAALLVMAAAFGVAWRLTAPRPTVVVAPRSLEADRRLEGYDWVDREHGIIRIPIERAMELVVDGKR